MRRQLGSEDLDRDQTTQLAIPGTVDLAHATAAKQLHQLITAPIKSARAPVSDHDPQRCPYFLTT
jgi:hypothetical protein